MQSPDSAPSPGTTQTDSSFFGKINLFAAPPNANNRMPITSSDAFRFQVGVNYKAKLIGVEEVEEARGDRMCQVAIQKQKAFIKATGAHKQRIQINVSLEGIKLVDQMTGATLHHHPVQRISFISRDVSDARAFGYIYGPGDGTHKFFGIKTEKAAENVVLTLRDLFQVVFEMKKKESEDEKKLKLDNKEMTKTEPTSRRRIRMLRQNEAPEPKQEVAAEPEKKEEPAASTGLMELETEMISLGFGQASQSQSADFDPLSGGGGGGGSMFSAQPQTTNNAFGQGFGGDAFAATSAPTSLPFSPPANTMGQPRPQNNWATFSPGGNPPAAAFPQQQTPAPAMGGFGGASPFGAAPTNQPMGGQPMGGQPMGGQPMASSNPFGGGFGAPAAAPPGGGFGAPAGGGAASFGSDPFGGGSLLAPSVTEPEPEPPQPPKRQDMFSNLVDGFGVDFGTKKEEAPAPKINDLVPKAPAAPQVSGFGDLTGGCGDSDPFDTTRVQREIRAQEMETAPNVYTKQISFSESDNDLTPDREVPAPTLPPPPLPSSVHSSQSTLHHPTPSPPAPNPPPRPGSGQQQATPPLPRHSPATPPIARGHTVDLGPAFPDAPPPPPPPRPGSRLSRQAVSYSAVPRPHPSPKHRRSPGHPSPHSSPHLQRQITAPSLSHPPTVPRSPQLTHHMRLHSDQTAPTSNPNTPPLSRQHFFPPTADFKADFSNPPVSAPSPHFQANFADFSNFSQQISTPSSSEVCEAAPPPPPPRPGTDRQRAPRLSADTRSMTMPAPQGGNTETQGPTAHTDIHKASTDNPDPFALTLPNPKKTRNVDSAYARPRPKARSKTPTLISTKSKSKSKSSLSSALRSESPVSQNSLSSREYEAGEHVTNSAAAKVAGQQRPEAAGHSNSPKEARLSGCQGHRTGTPVSMHSMQSASSGQSSEPAPDPFAHVDPFETRDTADPFDKDPFVEDKDPFKSPIDPFSKDLTDSEFKTKAIAITADGLEVSEQSSSPVTNGNPELKADPDPFSSDPFSMGTDPFQDKPGLPGLQLGRPLLGGSGQGVEQAFDPFDTAHVAGTLTKPSGQPEFSNNSHSGIVGLPNTGSHDLFRDFQLSGAKQAGHQHKQSEQTDSWAADFGGSNSGISGGHMDRFTAHPHQGATGADHSQYSQHQQLAASLRTSHRGDDPTTNTQINTQINTPPPNHEHHNMILTSSPHLANSPANHPGCHGVFNNPPRERHESDSTSYNSEISEAFASAALTSPSLTNQSTAVNGRGTPGNPFLTNHTSAPTQTYSPGGW